IDRCVVKNGGLFPYREPVSLRAAILELLQEANLTIHDHDEQPQGKEQYPLADDQPGWKGDIRKSNIHQAILSLSSAIVFAACIAARAKSRKPATRSIIAPGGALSCDGYVFPLQKTPPAKTVRNKLRSKPLP